ncbi:hypothetical protein FV232_12285 [Methylobacterium sp. WL30]|jgi:hypothetical protein|uniref:hypothetical protein n=1 Tax=unclassified Methylobacterium TaxID=2615210 RepID=UPI0011C753A9|nr:MULTISPECIES: hypothetical protein [unclassified Methylobacterium]MCJ2006861.1 hypothetical protein [Methylobacterium sp. J-092]TXM94144.1 hypothetical protein FV223_05720 [Methylobacterium sp. WL116]TXN39389.1 hypothetical protein FV225_10030 [Methylobacterium sp. WL93]TXN50221.1 hypothetical protein FV227_13155 [Methylobacterium sp. WL119]TXN67361.1 hypothetical protein FV232_12285 [Methylobacterium sp. WL30]
MTEREVENVVSSVLEHRFPGGQYKAAEVRFDTDFDGAPIIRVTARYNTRPASRAELVRTVHAIRDALIARGDDRFVFLSNDIADERQVHADVD